jgi:glycosyltransferase involved in cell wall biosynthesis
VEVHVANLYEDSTLPGLLDEIVESTAEDGVMIHRIPIGREELPPRATLWDSPNTSSIRLMYHSLERLHLKYDFDLFHAFFIYPIGYVAALLAEAYGKKLIVSIRGNDINQYIFSPEKATFLQTALRRADFITSVARDLLVKAETLTPVLKKSRVIFNSVIPRNGNPASLNLPVMEESVIGAVGRFKHSKGLPYLLKAFQSIRNERKGFLLLVGDIREEEQAVQNRYLSRFGSQGIHLTGPVPHEAVDSYLRRMDVFVLPSLSEGCPNVLLEAMAAERAIIATRTGAVPEIISHGESGLLVDVGDSRQIAEAIRWVFDHPGEAKKMGERARQKIGDFSLDGERSQWEDLYQTLGV